MFNVRPACVITLALLTLTSASADDHSSAPEQLPLPPEIASGYRPDMLAVQSSKHMAAAANPLATAAGLQMLRAGGSAIDAAVAMQAVLTLVEPQSSGIGGGAFLMYSDGQSDGQSDGKRVQAFDGRETAPAGVDENLFLQADGKPMAFNQARIGGRSVGVPGVLRALKLAHEQHGKLPWRDLFEPAIRLSREGFPISPRLYTQLAASRFIKDSPEMARYFLDANGEAKPVGSLLKNPALAETFEAIAKDGPDAFYRGAIAEAIVSKVGSHRNPGTLNLADLQGYKAKERTPVCADYKRWKICGMPPPSSGGIAVVQTLGILDALQRQSPRFDLASMRPTASDSAARLEPAAEAVHLLAEAQRLAFADRALYLADSDFIPVNVQGLTDSGYLAGRAALIGNQSMGRAQAGTPPGLKVAYAPDRSPLRISTSHLTAVDDQGGAIAMTTSVEAGFGSHIMVNGFLLNNQLTDFSFIPREAGKPVANCIEPGKRPLSSMAPTLVFDKASGELLATVGSPGGSQIVEYVNKTLIGLLDWQLDPQAAVNLPNFGSRNVGTEVEAELISDGVIEQLKARGHDVRPMHMTSGTQVIMRTANGWSGGADPRREGSAAGD